MMNIPVGRHRWVRTAFAALGLAVLLTACDGFYSGPSGMAWTESVRLDDGSEIVVKRYVRLRRQGAFGSPAATGVTEELESRIEFPAGLNVPPWNFPYRAMVIYRDATANDQWVIVATVTACDLLESRGRPWPPYWEWRLFEDGWRAVLLSPSSLGRTPNLMFDYLAGPTWLEPAHFTAEQIAASVRKGPGFNGYSAVRANPTGSQCGMASLPISLPLWLKQKDMIPAGPTAEDGYCVGLLAVLSKHGLVDTPVVQKPQIVVNDPADPRLARFNACAGVEGATFTGPRDVGDVEFRPYHLDPAINRSTRYQDLLAGRRTLETLSEDRPARWAGVELGRCEIVSEVPIHQTAAPLERGVRLPYQDSMLVVHDGRYAIIEYYLAQPTPDRREMILEAAVQGDDGRFEPRCRWDGLLPERKTEAEQPVPAQ